MRLKRNMLLMNFKFNLLKMSKLFVFLALNVCICSAVFSQLVDDSTVTNISLNQTGYYLKNDVFIGDTIRREIKQEERFDIYRYNLLPGQMTQNLGMYGSASLNLMTPYNTNLGAYDGISIYEHLAYQDADVKYYDTKVPYSFMSYRQSFGGTSYADGGYTQSVGESSNLGFEVRRFSTPINLGANPNNDQYSENTAFKFHASHLSKNGLYKALLNYRYMKNSANEIGGASYDSTMTNKDSVITIDYVETLLSGVVSEEKRNEWSFYQELSPFSNGGLKLFHSFDRTKKVNSYKDKSLSANRDYYGVLADTVTALQDSNVYKVIENKVGINGRLGQISYSGYLKNRLWKYESDTNRWDTSTVVLNYESDFYVGGDLFFQNKKRDVHALLEAEFGLDGTSKVELTSDLKYLKLSYLTLSNRTGLKQEKFQERHYQWDNDFKNYFVTDLKIEPYFKGKKIYASAYYRLQTYKNYVYYSDSLTPIQDNETRLANYIGGQVQIKLNKWKIGQYVQMATLDNVKFIAVPEVYAQTNIDYNFKVKWLPALRTNIGFDVIYFSEYKPMAFRSDLQSFVSQDEFLEDGYVKLDVYVNFRYKTVQVSVKGINLLEGVMSEGYYPTVGYFGKKKGVELGIKWMFFR